MQYVRLTVFFAVIVLFVATMLHEALQTDEEELLIRSERRLNLTSFSVYCLISAVGICGVGWLLNI